MAEEEIIAEIECSGWTDGWVEYLCMQRSPDGSVTLTSKAEDILGEENTLIGEVVWPEGVDPAVQEGNMDDWHEGLSEGTLPLPLTIGGKKVTEYADGRFYGEDLLPYDDESSATFKPGEGAKARAWVIEHYEGRSDGVDEAVLKRIEAALQPPSRG